MSTAFLLPALLLAAVAATAESLTVTPGCQASCGSVDIPYPFGIGKDCFRKGFGISCINNGSAAMPVLADTSIQVVHLSVEPAESQVMLPIGWQCYNASDPRDTYSNWSYAETTMNRDGVYRISDKRNMLVVLGCNTMGYTASQRSEGGSYSQTYYTGCMSYCNNSASAKDDKCAGVGCCHVDIPPGLTDNYFNFQEKDHSTMMDYSPCDYAFLVGRNNYTFRRSDLKMATNRTSPVWLDWAIRDNESTSILSCAKAAAKTNMGYACVSAHSECVDSTNGPGYICNCSKGYEGNAYVVNGCTNIDECARSGEYPCYGVCRDTQGSYHCSCRPGYQSNDPKTEQCTPKFPLAAQISVGIVGGTFLVAFITMLILLFKEKDKTKELYKKNGGPILEKAKVIKLFREVELKPILVSNNFTGRGGFGEVYKGQLNNELVAVKRPISGSALENEQFANEVIIQSQVIHKNIVRLIGCCLDVAIPMLVYEFLSNGSLNDILHGDNEVPLDLDARLSIAAESADGLAYMHSKARTKILHGDIKPANILLNDSLVPMISDFGISRLIVIDKKHTSNVIGDRSYMDQYIYRQACSPKKVMSTVLELYCWNLLAGRRPHIPTTIA